jgi:aryl carrier-like protein
MQAIIGLRAAGIPADVAHLYEAQTLGEFTELITAKTRQSR